MAPLVDKRPGDKIVYTEAYKMLVRGALFNAPNSIRENYRSTLSPISLGGIGVDNEIIGTTLKEQEIALLDKCVQEMQSVTAPSIEDAKRDPGLASAYVNKILKISDDYVKRLDYFKEDLATITGNIRARQIILQPIAHEREMQGSIQKSMDYRERIHNIKPELELTEEEANKKLEDFLSDDGESDDESTDSKFSME